MRARFFVVSGGLSLVAAAFVVQACGNTETATPATDAGADVIVEAAPPKEAVPVDDGAATCDLSAGFTAEIPDAAVADGATTTGLCLACTNAKCSQQVDDCNLDCPCQGIAANALECFLNNPKNPQICASAFLGVEQNTQTVGIALLTCINNGCKEECATAQFQDAGADAGN